MLGFAVALVAVQAGLAVAAPLVAPYDPLAQDILARLQGPGAAHWLGTDPFGRDVLSRILFGCRASLAIAAASVGEALAVGGSLGVRAAF